MALKPTIYKINIALSDLNRDHYDSLALTIAQHPSETLERMMARILAYSIDAQEHLSFTKGLSATEEPDIWAHTLDGQISLWLDIGEPQVDRIKKATRVAKNVHVYSFNSKSAVWWEQSKAKFARLPASVFQFDWESIQTLAAMVQRTMNICITISGNSAFVTTESGECEVTWVCLQSAG